MHRVTFYLLLAVVVAIGAASPASAKHHSHPQLVLEAKSMVGVDGAFVGSAFPVRGVPGDDLPWTAPAKTSVRLMSNGALTITVKGLLVEDGPNTPADLVGTNPDATFRGLVSCVTEVNGASAEVNVMTKPFKTNKHGDSRIVDKVALPTPCLAPIVMVIAGDRDEWFSMTGFESDESQSD